MRILLFARDPGGANVIGSLYSGLKNKPFDLRLFGKDMALSKYKEFGLTGEDVLSYSNVTNIFDVRKFLLKLKPQLIITGTSADDFTEKYIWKAAQDLQIPSFAIIDQWINYGIRFSQFNVDNIRKYEINKRHDYLPTGIFIMDNFAKQAMILEGFEENRLIVSGQPYFDFLIKKKNSISLKELQKVKKILGVDEKQKIITFASEPLTLTYGENNKGNYYWGYTEKTIFKNIIKVIKEADEEVKQNITLVIRLHPKEELDSYYEEVSELDSFGITAIAEKSLDRFALMEASQLIIGMSSMFLLEAAILKRPLMSVQVGLCQKSPFILDERGIIKSILSYEVLKEKLKDFLLFNKYERYDFSVEYGSVDRIIKFVEEYKCLI